MSGPSAPDPLESETELDGASNEDLPPEIQREIAVGGTDAGISTNDAIRALSRAARSFLLYEPRNQAIREFLADYREAMNRALEGFGLMDLEMRPFEMVREGEVVYLERDRERSLAFRLFRDGVRRLRIEPEVQWSELLRLLEILSIRYTGIRQQEDDIVTLLWKAGFKHIGIVAVEGFVPEEESAKGGVAEDGSIIKRKKRRQRASVAHVEAPEDWDLPIPAFVQVSELVYRAVDPERLKLLRAEAGSKQMPAHAVRLISKMLDVVADPLDPAKVDDIAHLISEVRDFLLSEGQLEWVVKLVTILEQRRAIDTLVIDAMLARFSDARALKRILHSIGKAVEQVPPELIHLMDMIPTDHVMQLTDLLSEERAPAARRITRMLIERYLADTDDVSPYFERMAGEEAGVLCDMLRAASHVVPTQTQDAIAQFAIHSAAEVQMEVLWALDRFEDESTIEKTLLSMLKSSFEEVRIRVIEHLDLYASEAAFSVLADHAKYRSTRGLGRRESEIIGKTLARLHAEKALPLLSDWVRPPGMFRRMVEMPGAQALQWVGVTGLETLDGDEIDDLIRWLSERAGEDLYKHCRMTLMRRRREGADRE
jgi:hypothetical protein